MTAEQYDQFFAVVVQGHWFASNDYEPWQEVSSMFPPRDLPPLDWVRTRANSYVILNNRSQGDLELMPGNADVVIVDCHN